MDEGALRKLVSPQTALGLGVRCAPAAVPRVDRFWRFLQPPWAGDCCLRRGRNEAGRASGLLLGRGTLEPCLGADVALETQRWSQAAAPGGTRTGLGRALGRGELQHELW